jgi:hypothetical protein
VVKVTDIVHRMLPDGTSAMHPPSWDACPTWPPDLFAVVATLVNRSGCYSRSRYSAGLLEQGCFTDDYRASVLRLGDEWRRGHFPEEVQGLWTVLQNAQLEVADVGDCVDWWDAAIRLLAIADEAASGFGFGSNTWDRLPLARLVFLEIYALENFANSARGEDVQTPRLPYLPNSLCIAVPRSEACVQPKTRTPQVGCTLRSLTHNLALLPPVGEVSTQWRYAAEGQGFREITRELNVIVIPYPYEIRSCCFRGERLAFEEVPMGFFSLEQEWLHGLKAQQLADFVKALIADAEMEVSRVHAIVFPEAALSQKLAEDLGKILAKTTKLELFLAGVIDDRGNGSTPVSRAYCEIFLDGKRVQWSQAKHHRWKLDAYQLKRYHLARGLSDRAVWWEKIDVSNRECIFYVFHHGASLAVLICEDLARIDPVQTVVRAIGPNLVVALLMDGPQLERRWPGRYATVLADDPGSAVLTLTSLGLMRRSDTPRAREIALWKDAQGAARELELPDGAHALVLTLLPTRETNLSSDLRTDNNMSIKISLAGVLGISVDSRKFPWLNGPG